MSKDSQDKDRLQVAFDYIKADAAKGDLVATEMSAQLILDLIKSRELKSAEALAEKIKESVLQRMKERYPLGDDQGRIPDGEMWANAVKYSLKEYKESLDA